MPNAFALHSSSGPTALGVACKVAPWSIEDVERIGHKALSFEQARAWEIEQYARMSPDERRRVAKALRDRFYGTNCPDVRDAVAGARKLRR